ncbi:MAG: terminase small subunit [Candidatus Brocadiia bacterium]
MTRKQKRFAKEYLTDFNATQAAIRAGYSPKGASVQGSRLLANAKVQAEIERLSKRKDEELDLSNERILERLAEIAFSDDETTRSSLRALDLLCKTRGMYLRKSEAEHENVTITLNMGGPEGPATEGEQQANRADRPGANK